MKDDVALQALLAVAIAVAVFAGARLLAILIEGGAQ